MKVEKIQSFIELPKRVLGPVSGRHYVNLEGHKSYNFFHKRIVRKAGISAMVRAKNEEKCIESSLLSIVNAFDEIIFIDNNSEDNTVEIVQSLSEKYNNIRVFSYPFNVSRCGDPHNVTPENSIHSLAYYYNWCLSHCTCGYVMKWDADMVLKKGHNERFRAFKSSLNTYWPVFVGVEVQTVYTKGEVVYVSLDELNIEHRIFPNRADVYFSKGKDFEELTAKLYKSRDLSFTELNLFELKDVDSDEFSHWDTTNFTTNRKKKEYERFQMVKRGDTDNFFNLTDKTIYS